MKMYWSVIPAAYPMKFYQRTSILLTFSFPELEADKDVQLLF